LEKIAPESNKVIGLEKFVSQDLIDMSMIQSQYYIVPEPAGEDAYVLLRTGLEKTGAVGFGKAVLFGKEVPVIIGWDGEGLCLYTLIDVRRIKESTPFFESTAKAKSSVEMNKVMVKLIESKMVDGFDEEDWDNKRDQLLLENIKLRIAGQPLNEQKIEEVKSMPNDLMAALLQSINKGNEMKRGKI
jgi:DNA end-binding protein Ku